MSGVSAFHRIIGFREKPFHSRRFASDRKGTLKTRKMLFFGSGSAHVRNFRNFSGYHPSSTAPLQGCRRNCGDPSGALQVLQKTTSFLFGLEPPMRRSRSKLGHRCLGCHLRCAKFHPDRLMFGSTGAKKRFLSENSRRP